MNCTKTGLLIAQLRKDKNITQKQLADMMHISDRTISKWERGMGTPDVSLLTDIADIFNINIETLLNGEIINNNIIGGNMKKIKYYICKTCGNIITSTGDTAVSCCDKKLTAQSPQKAEEHEYLDIETIDNELYITSNHPMEKDHYISFVAFSTGSQLQLIKQYPEWSLQVRIPHMKHGLLVWYCTKHGLFYQHL